MKGLIGSSPKSWHHICCKQSFKQCYIQRPITARINICESDFSNVCVSMAKADSCRDVKTGKNTWRMVCGSTLAMDTSSAPCSWRWSQNRARRQSGFPTFIPCQRQDANVLPKRRQSHQGDKLCDVSTVPLVARGPVFLARGSDADGEPH